MLSIWQIQAISKKAMNMYNVDYPQDGYCLSHHTRQRQDHLAYGWRYESKVIVIEQIKSFCLRPDEDIHSFVTADLVDATNSRMTFSELKEQNISIKTLLSWSASIDMAERYEIFLNNDSAPSSENEMVFYNCTGSWFGAVCQFTFEHLLGEGFGDIVIFTFPLKYMIFGDPKVTCYVHLTCQTLLSCLDWREICDGKQDCLDGADEDNCWQLEMNECDKDEYRCMNGQCIPWEFFQDGSSQPDCFDRTDERFINSNGCTKTSLFECEEYTCRPGTEEFVCGDGQCVNEMSRCYNGRDSFLSNNFCTNATLCSLEIFRQVDREWCLLYCSKNNCLKDNCSMPFEFRKLPLLFGHVRFIISNVTSDSNKIRLPDYICYNATLCPHLPPSTEFFNGLTCHHVNTLGLPHVDLHARLNELVDNTKNLFRGCLTIDNQIHICNSSTMYQCMNSTKCISKYRLLNSFRDCPFGDDEIYNQSCSLMDIHQRFKCIDEHEEKCLTILAKKNEKKECKYGEDEYTSDLTLIRTHISFQKICDGITHLLPLFIDGQNETDETGCELWPCNNTYSRCDQFWLCKHGDDEVNCPPSTCPEYHHHCILPNDSSRVSCLPMARTGDGFDDCIGATDERRKSVFMKTDSIYPFDYIKYNFRCRNDTILIGIFELCNGVVDCPSNADDESFCKNFVPPRDSICLDRLENKTDVEKFLCDFGSLISRDHILVLTLHNMFAYPTQLLTNNISIVPLNQIKSLSTPVNRKNELPPDFYWICNRGIPLRARMNDNTSERLCLCPPSYYGYRCQYQNQRVDLILHVRLTSDWQHTFVFLMTLVDNEGMIESYEHVEYVPARDCPIKYSLYLLYKTRPKNVSKRFSVQIDAFNQMTLNYRASWIFPLRFAFLPVQHLAVLLQVPFTTAILPHTKCSSPCIHGQCSLYINDQNSAFCHCESGWSGLQCDIKLKCTCAPDAICISDSVCLCPPGRWGPRCYLSYAMNDFKACMNGGQRAPVDARYLRNDKISSVCICPEGFIGDLCQHQQGKTQIDISFHSTLSIPPSLSVHFIGVRDQKKLKHNRTTTAKKIQFDQTSLTLYTTTSFNIAIARMLNQYYLIILREETIVTAHVSTEVIPNHRCRSIDELFNNTFSNQHLLKRIKLYHQPCQMDEELICFYDEIHICLCTLDRSANCFEFDHDMKYECEKAKYCGNDGECFQNDLNCPTSSFCACHRCYFGSRCQFSTKGSTLSLDIILGYHIYPKIDIQQQPIIVKIAIVLASIIFAIGVINGSLAMQTFRRKETRNVGCGLYLFTTSILSMIIVVILTLKFAFLLALQIGSIKDRWFLRIQCTSMDFLLRSLLSTSDWLSACVTIERLVSIIQGVRFNKTKSQQMAKWIILILFISTSVSYIYDPIHRQLMDDEEEQRTWCVTQYPPVVQIIDWTMNIFHFSIPFAINSISAAIVVLLIARTRLNSQKSKSFKEHLKEQFHHNKHLFISPLILIILALPRLILSFLTGCMGTARESWFYLFGYYISYLPNIMTVLVFILPSRLYKKEFYKTVKGIFTSNKTK